MDKQQEQIRQLERKLKQAVSEQEHLSDHNTILTTEIDKSVTHAMLFCHICTYCIHLDMSVFVSMHVSSV